MTVLPRRTEARFYERGSWDTTTCRLCPHLCSIAPSRSGTCGVRTNRNGLLYLDSYGKVAALEAVSACELPLYHYRPESRWLSVGMQGCNFRCGFCNTFRLSQLAGARTQPMMPRDLVAHATAMEVDGISFGGNEPVIAHEYVTDCFRAARSAGLATHAATNGSWMEDPFEEILPLTDAMTFGVKGFDERFLLGECGGRLEGLKSNVLVAHARGVHVEVAYLVIEAHEDWREQLALFAFWLRGISPEIPVILLGLEQAFSWKQPATSNSALAEAHEILGQQLPHVFASHRALGLMDTRCASCGRVLVRRGAGGTLIAPGAETRCPGCGTGVPYAEGSAGPS